MNNFILIKIKCGKIKVLLLFFLFLVAIPVLGEVPKNTKIALSVEILMTQKKVSLVFKNKPIRVILQEIYKQSTISFAIDEDIEKALSNLSISISNSTVEEALTTLLKNSGYHYVIKNNLISIQKERSSIKLPNKVTIKGKIIDSETKKGVPGATIIILGTTNGVISNEDGSFLLETKEGEEIQITYVGLISVNKLIAATDVNLVIEMKKDAIAVDDVIVTGYFNRNRDSYTGSAIQVKGDELRKMTSGNILSVLGTFDPSFRIVENNIDGSNPNSLPEFNIRGRSGIGLTEMDMEAIDRNNLKDNPNMPTFILDGYEVSADKIFDLDIQRIESVTILKDAAATAIYGSRAANGVVVVKTIAPKEGQLRVSYNFNAGIAVPDLTAYDLLNASEKLELERKNNQYVSDIADAQSNLTKEYNYKLSLVKKGVDTYWLSQPLRVQFNQKHTLYIDGGDNAVRYGINFSYNNDNGIMRESARNRGSLSFTLSYNLNDKFRFQNSISADIVASKNSPYGEFSQYALLNPYYPFKDQNGHLIKEQPQYINSSRQIFNPLYEATVGNIDKSKDVDFRDSFSFEWSIMQGLRFKGDFSYSLSYANKYRYVSPESLQYVNNSSTTVESLLERGEGYQSNGTNYSWNTNILLNYYKNFNNHLINIAVGTNMLENGGENSSFDVKGFPSKMFNYASLAKEYGTNKPGGMNSKTRLAGFFGNLNYSYANRYLLDLSYRLDGSSVYGSESKFSPFWAVGIGWNIHNEKFMKNLKFDLLKIRGSVGSTGKANFAPYQSQMMFEYITNNWYATGIGATVLAIGNEELKWEVTNSYDVGIDMAMLKNRLSLGVNYYLRTTKNLLSDISLPTSTGFDSYTENFGEMQNTGIEIYARGVPLRTDKFYISLFANLAYNKNRIMKISNALDSYNSKVDEAQSNDVNKLSKPMVRYKEGNSISAIYAMKSLGIDPATGKELYVNRDGTLTYDWTAAEQVALGDSDPKISGAFGININYKQFNLSTSFSYKLGGQTYNQTLVSRVENANLKDNVDRRVYEQRWQKPGDVVMFKNILDTKATPATSRFLQDDTIFEMNSINLSYDIDREVSRKIGMQNVRFSAMYNNLFRFSTVKQERGISYPFARNISFSLMIQF